MAAYAEADLNSTAAKAKECLRERHEGSHIEGWLIEIDHVPGVRKIQHVELGNAVSHCHSIGHAI